MDVKCPRLILMGGRIVQFVEMMLALLGCQNIALIGMAALTYRPTLIAVVGPAFSPSAGLSCSRRRSPRSVAPAMTTDLPPSIMFCFPSM